MSRHMEREEVNPAESKSLEEMTAALAASSLPPMQNTRSKNQGQQPVTNPETNRFVEEPFGAQNPFYLFMHGNLDKDGCLVMKHSYPRRMEGIWSVALAEIEFTQREAIFTEAEDIEYLVCAKREDHMAYLSFLSEIKNFSKQYSVFQPTEFTNFPHACLMKFTYGAYGSVPRTPEGYYTFEVWKDEMSKRMNNIDHVLEMGLYRHDAVEYRIVNSWNYANNYKMKVFVVPIFGPKTRKLINMPELLTKEFHDMINKMVNNQDTVLGHGKFNRSKRGNITVTCNIAEHNSETGKDHVCFSNVSEGHVLRHVTQNSHTHWGERTTVTYDKDKRLYIPVGINSYTGSPSDLKLTATSVRIITSDQNNPICCEGPVNVTLHAVPADHAYNQLTTDVSLQLDQNDKKPKQNSVTLMFEKNANNIESTSYDSWIVLKQQKS